MIDWDAFKKQMQAEPQKMLGFVLAIAVCFLVIWVLVVVQSDVTGPEQGVQQDSRLAELRSSMERAEPDSLALAADSTADPVSPVRQQVPPASPSSGPSTPFADAWPTFLILLAAVAGLWLWIKRRARTGAPRLQETGELFERVGTQPLGPDQDLTVIALNDEYWVMATGGGETRLLHRYHTDEWNGPVAPPAPAKGTGAAAGSAFSSILGKLKTKQATDPNGSGE